MYFNTREIRGFEREHAADEQEEKRDARERGRRATRREGAGLEGRSLNGRIPPSPPSPDGTNHRVRYGTRQIEGGTSTMKKFKLLVAVLMMVAFAGAGCKK